VHRDRVGSIRAGTSVQVSGLGTKYSGLYRVASFLGLGLSLVAIGYLYQRFVPTRATQMPSSPTDH